MPTKAKRHRSINALGKLITFRVGNQSCPFCQFNKESMKSDGMLVYSFQLLSIFRGLYDRA